MTSGRREPSSLLLQVIARILVGLQFLSSHCVVPEEHLTGLQLMRLKSSPSGCRKVRCPCINKVKSCLRASGSGWGGGHTQHPVHSGFSLWQPLPQALVLCWDSCVSAAEGF